MPKHKTQHHLLSKRDKKKHFSHELGGGKGDCPRQFTKAGNDSYRDNFDRIFGKAKQNKNREPEQASEPLLE